MVSKYSDSDFKRIFSLSRPTSDTINCFLQDCYELVVEGQGGREPIAVEKQLYVTLWYLGGSDSIIRITDRFGIAESSVVVCRNRIIDTILIIGSQSILTGHMLKYLNKPLTSFINETDSRELLGHLMELIFL